MLTPLSLQSTLLLGIVGTCSLNHPSPPSCLFTGSTERARFQKGKKKQGGLHCPKS